MNLLHDTMIEMGINSNMLKMFSSTGAVIDPRKQLYSIGIKVARDSNERFLSFLEPILVQEDGETVESGFVYYQLLNLIRYGLEVTQKVLAG